MGGKKKEKKQNSKDKQMYVKKIYIYSGIGIACKELYEKQLNILKKIKKLIQKKG